MAANIFELRARALESAVRSFEPTTTGEGSKVMQDIILERARIFVEWILEGLDPDLEVRDE